jgi:hypothetical protein
MTGRANTPVLKPYLNRTLCHINIFGNAFSDGGSRCRIFVEFNFKSEKLVLRCTLPLLVLLLLRKGAFSRRTPGSRVNAIRSRCGGRWC